MTARRYFLTAGIFAAGIWLLSHLALLFCFFTYQWIGKYIWQPFYFFAMWPDFTLTRILPKSIADAIYSFGWPASLCVSFFGWMILTVGISGILFAFLKLLPMKK